MKNITNSILLILLAVLSACEDPIDVDLDNGAAQLVVDGFLTSDTTIQTIRLTETADYFSNTRTPAVNNAQVTVQGPGGFVYSFISDNLGNFQYDPTTFGPLDSIGYNYQLNIIYRGKTFISSAILNPVPKIDSMTVSFEEEELDGEEGYYTQFRATDLPGREDFYWIKPFRNGFPLYFYDPSILILSVDAAFGGDGFDGAEFIVPIRAAITDEDDPFEVGEISSVELWSLNQSAYRFLEQLTIQANNGGLFSTPPANIRSNILDASGEQQNEVLGVFSLSSVSRSAVLITE